MLVLFFAFEDEPASRVDRVLRESTRSAGRRVGGGWVIDSVPNVRLDRIANTRRRLRALGGDFLSEHLPGAFASDLDAEHPACEVLTTKRWDPLDAARGRDELALDSEVVGAMANLRAQRSVWALTALVGAATTALVGYQIWG